MLNFIAVFVAGFGLGALASWIWLHWWDWRTCWAGLADKRRFVPGAGVGGGGTKAGTVQAQGVGWMLKDCAQNGTRWCLLYRAVDGADESPAYGLIHRDGTLAPGGEAFRAGP